MFCTNCGARLDEGVRFCTECGAPIEVEPQTPAAPIAEHAPAPEEPEPAVQPEPAPTEASPSEATTAMPSVSADPVVDRHDDVADQPTVALPSQQDPIADAPTSAMPEVPEIPDLQVPLITPDAPLPATPEQPAQSAEQPEQDTQVERISQTVPLPSAEPEPAPEPTSEPATAPLYVPEPAPAPAPAPLPDLMSVADPVEPIPAPQPRTPVVGSASAAPAPSFTPVTPGTPVYAPAPAPAPVSAPAPQPAPVAHVAAPAPAAATATRRKSHRGLIALLCILVVLTAGLVTAYFTLRATVFSPSGPLKEYVNAVSSGDYAKANELGDPGIDNAQRALLVSDVAKDQAKRIHDVSVSDPVKGANNTYTATVSYTVNGARQSMPVTVSSGGKQWLVFDSWKITTPMLEHLTVALPQSMHHITVNGVSLDLSTLGNGDPVTSDPTNSKNYDSSVDYQNMRKYQLSVYPGVYEFGIAPSSYVTAQSVTLTNPDDAAYLLPKETDKLRSALLDAVNKTVQPCIASTDIKPPSGCGYALDMTDTTATLGPSMTRTLKTKIALDDVDLDSGTFSTSQFEIEGSYQYQWAGETTWTDGKAWTYVTLTGTFSLDNEQLDVKVDTTD
ncbi:hypothetical protein G1C96_1569 [Bifidobacterium sp. DSM 109958]|uniref:Zinc-ribbon domain-containing protein n=1 Tax=Bifidobacterium moraviense TaxID=2675323 RepID=A0A7Y0F2U4_9BIFI|nr:zinc ribbon domain-containing protein [Bifidobacterium sp. DSM 109958]NMN00987.1 hypothetical protein [Bifidobacterium sp. DSM 109958]